MKTALFYFFLIVGIAKGFAQELNDPELSKQKLVVFFDFDQFLLNSDAMDKMDEFITGRKLEVSKIYGYCDWKGTNEYNDTLSQRRINEVYKYLMAKGIIIKEGYERRGFGEDFNQSKIQSENRKVTVIFDEPRDVLLPDDGSSLTAAMKTMKVGDKIRLKNINFHNNSAVIVQRSKPALYELLCIMEENPTLKIEIQGHICCQPLSDVNDVSTARAKAIYNFLVRNKINRKRLAFKGFGVTKPIHAIPEKTDQEADENRRVEIEITEN